MRAVVLLVATALTGCVNIPTPSALPAGTPQAKLRVAVVSSRATNITLMRVLEMACATGSSLTGMQTGIQMLGWFHPHASGEWQRNRRHFGLRQQMSIPAIVPENMYAEHIVSTEGAFFIQYGAALTLCGAVTRLPLRSGWEYEFFLPVAADGCRPRLFELEDVGVGNIRRVEVPLARPVEGFHCRN